MCTALQKIVKISRNENYFSIYFYKNAAVFLTLFLFPRDLTTWCFYCNTLWKDSQFWMVETLDNKKEYKICQKWNVSRVLISKEKGKAWVRRNFYLTQQFRWKPRNLSLTNKMHPKLFSFLTEIVLFCMIEFTFNNIVIDKIDSILLLFSS